MSKEYEAAKRNALQNPLTPDDPRHGTANGYGNRRCRCDACKEAWAERCLRRRAERRASLADGATVEHGSSSTYLNWGCRCEACTKAHTQRRTSA